MIFVALRMLMGDRAKYIGIVLGVTIASMLITQQVAVFAGLMTRTYGFISDTAQPDIWVMDPKVRLVDDLKPMETTELLRVRSVAGVAWAVPLYKGLLRARLDDGGYQTCNVVGLDDASLLGGPPEMLKGKLSDLRHSDGIIIDEVSTQVPKGKLVRWVNGQPKPVGIGDTLEINDHRTVVVGICRCSRTFQSQPVIYTTYSRATGWAPPERKNMPFILVGVTPGRDLHGVCDAIAQKTKLKALIGRTDNPVFGDGFKSLTFWYYMKYTGIPFNFGIVTVLGFVVGAAIAGLLFFNFTQDNIRHFGSLKAMGISNWRLLGMVMAQSALVSAIGYGIGVGLAAFMGYRLRDTELSFSLQWWLLAGAAAAIMLISLLAATLSMIKVWRLEPAVVFRS